MDRKNNKKLLEKSLTVLKKFEEAGFQAYIVGGFVRDWKLRRQTSDVDIATNATPKEIREIFPENCLPKEEYGSVTLFFQGTAFDITTFRREITYQDYRKPVEFEYIDKLEQDLTRRDFLMNTLCMDSSGKIIDHLNAMNDIKTKTIHTVGPSNEKFQQDALRMLRAIRFATVLHFKLSQEVKEAILSNRFLLKKLSYERKRKELDKIFTSKNIRYGISLLLELGLEEYLDLPNLPKLRYYGDLCGIWAILDTKYPFTKNESQIIHLVQQASKENLKDPRVLYRYDLYVAMIAADIQGISKKEITKRYNHLPIQSRKEIALDGNEIMNLLEVKEGPLIKEILEDLEEQILMRKIKNKKLDLKKYIVKHYKKC